MTALPKPEVIITHESDLDGFLSGLLLQRLAKHLFGEEVRLEAYHYNYWKQRDLREKSAWVTDFTFETRMDKPDWVVVDHHVTEVAPKSAQLIHDVAKSAGLLAYELCRANGLGSPALDRLGTFQRCGRFVSGKGPGLHRGRRLREPGEMLPVLEPAHGDWRRPGKAAGPSAAGSHGRETPRRGPDRLGVEPPAHPRTLADGRLCGYRHRQQQPDRASTARNRRHEVSGADDAVPARRTPFSPASAAATARRCKSRRNFKAAAMATPPARCCPSPSAPSRTAWSLSKRR